MCLKDEKLLFYKILNVLKYNGVVVMPCDTIYGFLGIAPWTQKTIQELKGRDDKKPFIILIRKEWILQYTSFKIDKYFLDKWPGPLTIIVPDKNKSTVALRVPKDKRLLKLLSKLDQPLFSTSVNHIGKPALNKSKEIKTEFGDKIDLFVDEGDLLENIPSTIIDLCTKPYRIIRPGACRIDPEKLV